MLVLTLIIANEFSNSSKSQRTLLIAIKHAWLLKGLNSSMALIMMIPSIQLLSTQPFDSYYLLLFLVVGLFDVYMKSPLDLWILNILVISASWISRFMTSNRLHVPDFLALASNYYSWVLHLQRLMSLFSFLARRAFGCISSSMLMTLLSSAHLLRLLRNFLHSFRMILWSRILAL